MDTLSDHNLLQLVDSPTRNHNILDLFATNRPSLVTECITIPGISDHEAVSVLSYVKARTQSPATRKIYLWHKANFHPIKEKIQQFSSILLSHHSLDFPVNTLWSDFKELCDNRFSLISCKLIATNINHPYISPLIKRLSRRKQCCYNRAKQSHGTEYWQLYYNLKK